MQNLRGLCLPGRSPHALRVHCSSIPSSPNDLCPQWWQPDAALGWEQALGLGSTGRVGRLAQVTAPHPHPGRHTGWPAGLGGSRFLSGEG